jgi:hypothetical protein
MPIPTRLSTRVGRQKAERKNVEKKMVEIFIEVEKYRKEKCRK